MSAVAEQYSPSEMQLLCLEALLPQELPSRYLKDLSGAFSTRLLNMIG